MGEKYFRPFLSLLFLSSRTWCGVSLHYRKCGDTASSAGWRPQKKILLIPKILQKSRFRK